MRPSQDVTLFSIHAAIQFGCLGWGCTLVIMTCFVRKLMKPSIAHSTNSTFNEMVGSLVHCYETVKQNMATILCITMLATVEDNLKLLWPQCDCLAVSCVQPYRGGDLAILYGTLLFKGSREDRFWPSATYFRTCHCRCTWIMPYQFQPRRTPWQALVISEGLIQSI